jgi:tetratricopeptide (TPR) repeat protein
MPDTAGLAIDLAMEEARSDPSLRDHVRAFLDDQRALIADQRHHMRKQLPQIVLRNWELRMGVLLRLATAFIGMTVAAGAAWLVWNAAHSNDLVIDAFQVPPALAVRGLSGPVVAAKLSDKIAAMQAQTFSQRSPRSYANGISEGLKLEIPETGVSLSELDRFLREKLGHDLHIGGEMIEAGGGIALTARIGTEGSATVTGTEADMDGLLQKLAEQVYRITQPYRFATWLPMNRAQERIAIMEKLAASGPDRERAWAYNGWAVSTQQLQNRKAGRALLERGITLDPNHYLLRANLATDDGRAGRTEEAVHGIEATMALLAAHGRDYTPPDRIDAAEHGYRAVILFYQGAALEAAEQARIFDAAGPTSIAAASTGILIESLAALHEPDAARIALAQDKPFTGANAGMNDMLLLRARIVAALAAEDWPAALLLEQRFGPLVTRYPGVASFRPTLFDPLVGLALARTGQFAAAEARLKYMPGDCYPCLRARAQIAELRGQSARADFWFAQAAAIGPSLPHAESEWGMALLARDKPDDAIVQFKLANKKGPKFADPLEGWGEALMAKNQSHRALEKFAAAEKYAPNWGRLHLKWGEALFYAGKKDEAKKQFARAAQLDLTPSEKTELGRHGRL